MSEETREKRDNVDSDSTAVSTEMDGRMRAREGEEER